MKPIRPLDKYLSNTPNGSYIKIVEEVKNEKCWKKKLVMINLKINNKKEIRDRLIEELIILYKSNASKHKQFLKEMEIKETETYLSDCYLVKKEIILKTIRNDECK